jgi:hypothetical protein
MLTTHLHLALGLGMSSAISLLPYMLTWHEQALKFTYHVKSNTVFILRGGVGGLIKVLVVKR